MSDVDRIKAFVRDRNEALQDPSKLAAFCKKWHIQMPSHPEVVRRAILKARTAIPALPEEMRRDAKRQLDEVGSESFDDGDVQP